MSEIAVAAPSDRKTPAHKGSLYNPVIDFLLLGGASLFVLPLAGLIDAQSATTVLTAAFWLSFVINYPHFAHSYQIFYRDFGNKIAGRGYARHLQARYIFAGLVVPAIIACYFFYASQTLSNELVRFSLNAMGFFVGWHYVKQGYGILIVDSVFQRSFFSDTEKKILRANAYACWIFLYLLTNYTLHAGVRQGDLYGLKSYFLDVPSSVIYAMASVAAVTTAAAATAGWSAWKRNRGKRFPLNGWTAYFFSLYVWLGSFYSLSIIAIIPALHSLQYLAVVWRYETNRQRSNAEGFRYLARFAVGGFVLGALGFALIPVSLDNTIAYDQAVLGTQFFTAAFAIFINIHHYFLDNVMWRKDNPDVSRNLFAVR